MLFPLISDIARRPSEGSSEGVLTAMGSSNAAECISLQNRPLGTTLLDVSSETLFATIVVNYTMKYTEHRGAARPPFGPVLPKRGFSFAARRCETALPWCVRIVRLAFARGCPFGAAR